MAGSRPIRSGPCRQAGDMVGLALAIDMAYPAFYRIGYNAGTGRVLDRL